MWTQFVVTWGRWILGLVMGRKCANHSYIKWFSVIKEILWNVMLQTKLKCLFVPDVIHNESINSRILRNLISTKILKKHKCLNQANGYWLRIPSEMMGGHDLNCNRESPEAGSWKSLYWKYSRRRVRQTTVLKVFDWKK